MQSHFWSETAKGGIFIVIKHRTGKLEFYTQQNIFLKMTAK